MPPLPYASRAYQTTATETADPRHQVVLLFEALVRFLHRARQHMTDGDRYEQCQALVRAQKILSALMAALDRRHAPEFANQLFALYNWLHLKLSEAGISEDQAVLGEVLTIAEQLREAWQQAEINCQTEGTHGPATAVVGGAVRSAA